MPGKRQQQPERFEGDKSSPHGLGSLHVAFIQWLRDRNYSESTMDQRRRALNDFILWAEERSLRHPTELTRGVLERYQRHLATTVGPKTKRPTSFRIQFNCLCAIRAWFRWLLRQQYLVHNPANDLELPKLGHPLPQHVLTREQSEDILNQVDITGPLGLRDRAILEVFYSTGIRRSELIHLHVHDVDAVRGVLAVRQGKGRKDRMVPIGARALAWLLKYQSDVRPMLLCDLQETALFLTRYGGPFSAGSMTKLVSDYVRRSEVATTGSCHLFRHAMATSMLEHGADIRFIQAMLGHAKLDTTQIYTRVSVKKLKEVHDRTHGPRHVNDAAANDSASEQLPSAESERDTSS